VQRLSEDAYLGILEGHVLSLEEGVGFHCFIPPVVDYERLNRLRGAATCPAGGF